MEKWTQVLKEQLLKVSLSKGFSNEGL